MDFLFSEDLKAFAEVLRDCFKDSLPEGFLRRRLLSEDGVVPRELPVDSKFDESLWKKLADLGVFSAAAPEDQDGLGLGALSVATVIEAQAEVLLPLPVFETLVFGLTAALQLGDREKCRKLVADIASGSVSVTGAFHDLAVGSLVSVATPIEGKPANVPNYHLTGTCNLVSSLEDVDFVLIPSQIAGSDLTGLFLVSTTALSSGVERLNSLDLLRPYYRLELNAVAAQRLDSPSGVSADSMQAYLDFVSAALSAELVGVGRRALSMAVEHVNQREQFGRAIGSFQAVQHQLADVLLALEQAGALSRFAFWCCDRDPRQRHRVSAAVKAFAGEVIPRAIEATIQVHGGIGFTFEYDLHLYLRRAVALSEWFGSVASYEDMVSADFLEECRALRPA